MIKFIYENRISQWVTVIVWLITLRALHFYVTLYDFDINTKFTQRGLLHPIFTLINQNIYLSFGIATLLIIIQGLIIRYLCWEYQTLDKSGYSVLFFYAHLSLLFNGHVFLNYVSVGCLFLLLGIWFFYKFLRGNYVRVNLFFSALFMGFSALVVPEFFWSLVFLVILVMAFKASEAVDVFVIVFGFLMPYYLISSLGYLFDADLDFKKSLQLWSAVKMPGTRYFEQLTGANLLVLISVILVALFGAVKIFGSYYRHNIDARRSRLAMAFFSVFLLLLWIFNFQAFPDFFLLIAVPLSIYTSNAFLSEKSNILKTITFYIYVVTVILAGFIT